MALIPDLPAASSLSNTDLLVIDTGSQTQKLQASKLRPFLELDQVRFIQYSTAATTITLTIPTSSRHLLITNAAASQIQGMYIIGVTTTGVVVVTEVQAASGMTHSQSTNTMTFTTTSTSVKLFTDICLLGDLITLS